jgi:hypothetical protein
MIFSEEEALDLIRQLALGLEHLHKFGRRQFAYPPGIVFARWVKENWVYKSLVFV